MAELDGLVAVILVLGLLQRTRLQVFCSFHPNPYNNPVNRGSIIFFNPLNPINSGSDKRFYIFLSNL